jgi:hypothetical protein
MNNLKFSKVLAIASFITIISFFGNIKVYADNYNYGAMLGFTGSTVDGAIYSGYNKLGFTGGIFANRKYSEIWSLQAELKYIMKGAAITSSANNSSVFSSTIQLNYIEFPVLIKAKTSQKIEFETGLAEAYLLSSNQNFAGGTSENFPINKTDFSFIAGISYLYNENFTFNLKFSHSLKRISYTAADNITIFGTYGQYNNLLDFSVYYNIK